MNVWQTCTDSKDAVPLLRSRGLFLKPVALLHISVRLPQLKIPGNAISNWEIMEKLKFWIKPEEFVSLKVSKSTLEFIRFDGEVMSKSKLAHILSRLDGRSLKVPGIKEHLKVRAVEAKPDFPSKYDWDSYFRDAKNMNEMKAGERPDTVYVGNIPCAWLSTEKNDKPSERLLRKIFEQFGEVKRIDIPMLDPFRNQMNNNISGIKQFTFNKSVIFECYIQYVDYFSFVKCMDALRGMKLLYVKDQNEAFTASIKVDFDKLKHMSDASIQRRAIIRERLEKKEAHRLTEEMKKKEEEEKKEQEKNLEKLKRQKLREQRRKEKELEKLRMSEVDEMSKKIAAEEYLLLMAQRKLESIRLLSELINRVKNSREKELESAPALKRRQRKEIEDGNDGKKFKDDMVDEKSKAEKDLRYKLIQNFKRIQQREMIRENIKLKSRISDTSELLKDNGETSFTRSLSPGSDDETNVNSRLNDRDSSSREGYQRYPNRGGFRWNGRMRSDYPYYRNNNNFNCRDDSQQMYGRYGRGGGRGGRPPFKNQRYQNSWGHDQYQNQLAMPFLDPILLSYSHEYYKYLQKLAREAKRRKRSRSRSSSRSRSQSRSRSRSYSRSYTRSRSRSRSRGRSRSRSSSRSRSRSRRSRNRSRSYTRSYSKSYTRSRSRSKRKSKSRSRSRSRTPKKNATTGGENDAIRSTSREKKSPDKTAEKDGNGTSNGKISKKSKSKERAGSKKSKKSGKKMKKKKSDDKN